jgi:uncharacterized Fe-S cluster-containing radical SAM superfamily protein
MDIRTIGIGTGRDRGCAILCGFCKGWKEETVPLRMGRRSGAIDLATFPITRVPQANC